MSMNDADLACAICGEPATAAQSAECNWCDRRYHLNQRNDIEARDCGQVWIDEEYLALQFACNDCVARGGSPPTGDAHHDAPRLQALPARRRRYRRIQ